MFYKIVLILFPKFQKNVIAPYTILSTSTKTQFHTIYNEVLKISTISPSKVLFHNSDKKMRENYMDGEDEQ